MAFAGPAHIPVYISKLEANCVACASKLIPFTKLPRSRSASFVKKVPRFDVRSRSRDLQSHLQSTFLGSFERIEMALGMHPEAARRTSRVGFAESLNPPSVSAVLDQSRSLQTSQVVSSPSCQQRQMPGDSVVDDPDLTKLPIIHCWPEDGGRFITFPLIATQHPVSHRRATSASIACSFSTRQPPACIGRSRRAADSTTTKRKSAEKPCRQQWCSERTQRLMLAAMFPLPEGFEEVAFAGILRERATQLVSATTNDISVPANAEIILEGEVPPGERRLEGPFGDHFGHYCDAADFPVFRVRRITHPSQSNLPRSNRRQAAAGRSLHGRRVADDHGAA